MYMMDAWTPRTNARQGPKTSKASPTVASAEKIAFWRDRRFRRDSALNVSRPVALSGDSTSDMKNSWKGNERRELTSSLFRMRNGEAEILILTRSEGEMEKANFPVRRRKEESIATNKKATVQNPNREEANSSSIPVTRVFLKRSSELPPMPQQDHQIRRTPSTYQTL